MAFGTYSPSRAGELCDQLDRQLGVIENRVHYLLSSVPSTGAISARAEEALDSLREVTQDLQEIVDQRTEAPKQEVPW